MAIELRQHLKLAQQLIMTPQLQQAIKLLQLSRLELLETISEELQDNPLLEESQDVEPEQEGRAEEEQPVNREASVPEVTEVTIDEKAKEDFDWENYLGDYSSGSKVRMEREERRELPAIESRLVQKPSLDAHLQWQLHMSNLNETQKEVGTMILGNLGRDGYLKATAAEIAEMAECEEPLVEEVLHHVHGFDPLGVAARDLQECLLIQARSLQLEDDLVVNIITNHLRDLENRNYHAIVKATGRNPEEIREAIDIITGLDPKPGRQYDEEEVQYISPDIFVYKVEDEFVILLNEDGMPKLRISPFYREALSKDGNVTEQAREYIQGKLRSAAWLIKSIHQRQKTIYRVMESILAFQREFFDKGIAYLKPMVLRDVAQDIQMHESTISRVTTNKYAFTPQGIFELKYFFNSSIRRSHGGSIASASVQEKIRQIIANEDSKKPYSDDKIARILKEDQIHIARRTVAKYREMLKVLPSNKRKQI